MSDLPNPWFGKLKSRWPVVPIRGVAKLGTGHTPSRSVPEYWENCTIPWVTVEDIRREGEWAMTPLLETEQQISELGLANSAAVLHPAGTVMLSRTASIGLSCIVGRPMATTQAFVTWTPKDEVLDGEYLLAALKAMSQQFEYLAYGATHLTIYFPDISVLRIPLPPRDVQAAVVAFIKRETAKIDALIAEQQRLVELLQEKRQAVISHAVTKGLNPDTPMKDSGIEWLGAVPEHWEVGPLKRFWATTDCKHITAEFVEEGYPLASIREVQSRWVDLSGAKQTTEHFYLQLIEGGRKPMEGDLIFSRNATVGEVAQVPVNPPAFAMGQDVCLLRRHHAGYSADYLHAVLRSPVVVEQIAQLMIGSTFKRINVEEIRGLMVPMPPADEQVAIAAAIARAASETDCLTVEAERTVSLLQERRSALISAAVTGQIDVRGLAGSEAA